MQSLNDKKWDKVCVFGDEGFLKINATNSGVDSIRLKNGDEMPIPYITRSNSNNGIANFVSENNFDFGSDDAGCITVGLDTQTAFYQPHKFVTGQNIQIITNDFLNENNAPFYVTILKNQMIAKFNWGGNGATLGRMKRLEALIPVTNTGDPDYNYMEEYTQQKRKSMLKKYRVHVEKQISEIGKPINIPKLNEKKWEPIRIIELFDSFVPGKSKGLNHLLRTSNGGINYIGATNRNNGVLCYVLNDESTKKMALPGNCIGFIKNGDGSAGYAIYKAESFISTSDVIYGYADWINRFTGIFFVAAQDMIEDKYSHGYKRNKDHLKGDMVMLPVTDEGTPDYEYMEQYSKNLMLKKYKQYLSYLDSKLSQE